MVVVTFITLYVNYLISVKPVNMWFVIDSISKSVSIITIIAIIFCKYLWKFNILKGWLIKIPNINGTWEGFILSDWVDPITGKTPSKIPVILSIKQSLLNISCVMRTQEMISRSINCSYNINQDEQLLQLTYIYLSTPHQNIQERSRQHHGAIIFDIAELEDKKIKLFGNYWTGRKTTGKIDLEYLKKTILNEFPTKYCDHPVTEVRK